MMRQELYMVGCQAVITFCSSNELPPVILHPHSKGNWRFDACAYYRKDQINICVERCAHIGYGGRAWSYPGYVVDRTPYGILAHETGHRMDFSRSGKRGPYFGDFSVALRGRTGEPPITTYAPNDAEWFAEIARLFITNPDLLRLIRPRTYKELRSQFEPVFSDSWEQRLEGAPDRTIKAAKNKIEAAH